MYIETFTIEKNAPAETPDSRSQENRGLHSKDAAPWSGTLQRHPAAAPATKFQSANSTLTAAPSCTISYIWTKNPDGFAIWGKRFK